MWDYENSELKEKWDAAGTYCDMDFLRAALAFVNMPIKDALRSENYIIKVFAILDRRTGKRTLQKIAEGKEYLNYPEWAKQFFILRLDN